MTKYKVGDVAALFSKPKNPTTTAGKKLQSLFQDYYSKKSKFAFRCQEENSEFKKNEEKEILNDQSVSKKGKKRKFSYVDDSELNENVSSKKFRESSEHEDSKNSEKNKPKKRKMRDFSEKNNNDSELSGNVYLEKFKESPERSKINKDKKLKNFKNQNDFSRANNNDSEFNDKVFSKKFKESPESFKNNKDDKFKKFKKEDFPRNNKQSRLNLFNTKATFPNFEAENVSKHDLQLPSAIILKNAPKDNKQNKKFIKKSKKQSLNYSSKLSNDTIHKDSYNSDDASLKKEIEEFMHNSSEKLKIENKNGSNKQENSFNSKGQGTMIKPKKKFLSNQDIFPEKYEKSSEQDIKTKKMNKKNDFQQSFPRTKKESKPNFFNFGNTKSEVKHDDVEQNSASKKQNSVDQDHVKKSKKSKDRLNSTDTDSFIESRNNFESNTPKVKETAADFIRKPKNKKNGGDAFNADNFKKPNNKVFGSVNADKIFKNGGDNNSNGIQKIQAKYFIEETLDGIKLPSLAEENDEKNPEERLSRTLFVGNLPKNTSKREVKNLFTTFGKIESIRLAGVETDKAKIYSKTPPKLLHSNYASDTIPGFIVFSDKQSAVEALTLSGSVFKNHHITVDFALPAGTHKLYDDKRSIFIGNLPFDVKDESVWNAFNQCGRIECVRVVKDRNTGLGKGFGYVLFSTVESKKNAMALEGLNIEGREIRIKAVNSNKKVQKSDPSSFKRDTFKSRAIRLKKNSNMTGNKSIRKLTNKQKILHKKKKISAILQKAMK